MLRSLCFFFLALFLLKPSNLVAESPKPEKAPMVRREVAKPNLPAAKPAQKKEKSEKADKKQANASEEKKKPAKMVPLTFAQGKRDPYWDRPYLLAAYALVWIVFFFYLLSMRSRQSEVQTELKRLQHEIDALKKS